MARKQNDKKAFWFEGFKIEYSSFQKRWFVMDWDYEDGLRDTGPSHPSKYAAMDWVSRSILGY